MTLDERIEAAAIALAHGAHRWGFLTKQERDEYRAAVRPIIAAFQAGAPGVEIDCGSECCICTGTFIWEIYPCPNNGKYVIVPFLEGNQ
jgi:hypothetical protein